MANPPVPSLSRARELKIEELSNHFANDDLSLEELERRIERVYKATSVGELDSITADLLQPKSVSARRLPDPDRGNPPRAGLAAPYEPPPSRFLSLMSSTRKVGRWSVPRQLDVVGIMSDTRIDFTHAVFPTGGAPVEIHLRAMMASVRLVVPPGMRVIVDTHSVMSNVESQADEMAPEGRGLGTVGPVVRLSGFALMSDLKVSVRRREGPNDDDEDD